MATYQRRSRIGDGGQGEVYRGVRADDGLEVALKYLPIGANEERERRFAREVRLQARLDHPNILPVLGYRLTEQPMFFAMPLANCNLRDRLEVLRADHELAYSYFEQILAAVEHAHANGVIHRDLKPENILILNGPEGEYPAISDFGIGREVERETPALTGSAAFMGTFGYAAPEQAGGARDVDERCDIYSLGVIFYELLTGHGLTAVGNFGSLPSGLGYIVERCLQGNPSDRYRSVTELRQDFALFTRASDLLEEPEQAARRQLEVLASRSILAREDIWALNRTFHDHLDDENLLTRVFPRLPDQVLDGYVEYFPGDFKDVLTAYDQAVSGGLPFEYCDVVARFYKKLYERVRDAPTRRLVLSRLLDMGVSHNRFFVMGLFLEMLSAIRDPAEAAIARDVLLADPRNCSKLEADLLDTVRLPLLREAVREAVRRVREVDDEDDEA